ncbi:MAG: RagB/SusD family nutrient uptake outer membrane protein [Prevotella sp.]|nr:RagB/SusD family nutrient uptake outer membrane protein [Prevotella sp.]
MKKIILFFAGVMALTFSSCDDMLDVDGGRDVELPEINQKTDSLFYVSGIMQAMQQAAEVYVIQNEMRGDMVTTTEHSDVNLQNLSNFSASTENKYDSAYVYYKVINNCNYYLAHRDTTLYDGSYNVTLSEYAAVLSYRAWAYLQLARTYGKAKFFTHPLTTLSDIENDNSPELGIDGIVAGLETEMKKFANTPMPYQGLVFQNRIWSRLCIPVNVVLGDMYLEAGRYADAANAYYEFLFNNKIVAKQLACNFILRDGVDKPVDFDEDFNINISWSRFSNTISTSLASSGVITYVPMADDRLQGYTTELPRLFGYNYYYSNSHDDKDLNMDSVYLEKIQMVPSQSYYNVVDSSDYYYQTNDPTDPVMKSISKAGDMRKEARTRRLLFNGRQWEAPTTYIGGYVYLYRTSTVWLHLAEALNRMGHPDAAFAVLKDGIRDETLRYGYISDDTKTLLTTVLPFCSVDGQSEQSQIFSNGTQGNYGIHSYGCADNYGMTSEKSLYTFSGEVERKIAAIKEEFKDLNLSIPTTGIEVRYNELKAKFDAGEGLTEEEFDEYTELIQRMKRAENRNIGDVINAVEDLICDEYAAELAFEGSRFADLARIARNKNGNGTGAHTGSPDYYGANFGGLWLAKKLAFKNPVKDLTVEANWYLRMK